MLSLCSVFICCSSFPLTFYFCIISNLYTNFKSRYRKFPYPFTQTPSNIKLYHLCFISHFLLLNHLSVHCLNDVHSQLHPSTFHSDRGPLCYRHEFPNLWSSQAGGYNAPGFQISIRLKLLLTGTSPQELEQHLEFPDKKRAVTIVLPVRLFAF